ncbi:MAG: hypothetical protein WCF81_00035 [Roseiarcus sp.]
MAKQEVEKAWISLDFLVRIEPFQLVTRDFRLKKFLAPFAAVAAAPGRAQRSLALGKRKDWSSGKLNLVSDFLQQVAVQPDGCARRKGEHVGRKALVNYG